MTAHKPNHTVLTSSSVPPSQPAGKPQFVARMPYEVVGTGFDLRILIAFTKLVILNLQAKQSVRVRSRTQHPEH